MPVAKMKLVNIVGRLKDFDKVVQSCCIKGNFHPEFSSLALENVEEFVPIEDTNPYEKITQRAVDIGVHSDIPLGYRDFSRLGMDLDALTAYVDKTDRELNTLNGKVSELTQQAARLEQVLTALSHLNDFGINLDELFGCRNVVFRFGRLPKDSYYKISNDDEYDNRLFFPLEEDELFFWGFYVAKKEEEAEAEEFYASLYFEYIRIIENAHGTPSQAHEDISRQLAKTKSDLDAAKAEVQKYWKENIEMFLTVYSNIRYLHDCFDIRKYAAKQNNNFYIFGWVKEADISSFVEQFDHLPNVDCVVESTQEAENVTPPTSLVNNKAAKPFENFVGMYGLPSYNEMDPTPFMAVTYAVIFGIMFGDLGQGFVVLLIALFMKKRKMFLGDIMIRCSFFSMLFGFLYNSIFGFDGLLPFTVLPVHNNSYTNTVLLISVGFGMLLILTCMIFNIVNGVRQKNIRKFIFSQNGLAGFLFYASVITGAVLLMLFNKNVFTPIFIIVLVVIPILLIAFQEPLTELCERKKNWMPQKKGEFFMLSFFEMFEILLSFVSNTISYIRIGAFILSHSAMMIAVFTIAKMIGGGGSPIVIVFGNIFVIGLEGLVVGIQGLRLQFYEIFSRFFEGAGKPYEPVKIKYDV